MGSMRFPRMSRKQGKDEAMEREQSMDEMAEESSAVNGGNETDGAGSGDPAELEALRA